MDMTPESQSNLAEVETFGAGEPADDPWPPAEERVCDAQPSDASDHFTAGFRPLLRVR